MQEKSIAVDARTATAERRLLRNRNSPYSFLDNHVLGDLND